MSYTLSSFLNSQSSLVQEAAEALPHQFSQCTYSLGPRRQAVYLCKTCGDTRGICSACSIACHTDHEQLELFPKRKFRCDCPTNAMSFQCTLHKTVEPENTENTYGHNFLGKFCRCEREYDVQRERETMIQCLACEDWFHESCLNLRERPPSREPTPKPEQDAPEPDDGASEASSSGLPPPLISASDYDALVCSSCVRKIDTLRHYAGTSGVLMVVRDSPSDKWKVIGLNHAEDDVVEVESSQVASNAGEKRARSPEEPEAPDPKRARLTADAAASSTKCLAPTADVFVQDLLFAAKSAREEVSEPFDSLGSGDVFLTEGFRNRWCRCDICLPSLRAEPYLLEEEETYEPPEDPDSGLSLEELGLRALQRLPRDRAIDGIRAFNEMRDDLMKHLQPFAREGKVVTEEDIRAFFDSRSQTSK